jgi:hypothetical protein
MASRRKREQQAAAAAAAAAAQRVHKPSFFQYALVIGVAVAALIAAMLVVPPLARAAGLFEQHVGYATAGAAFLIVLVAVRRLRSLHQQSADRTGTKTRKR